MYHHELDDQDDERDVQVYNTDLSPGELSTPDGGFLVEEGFDESLWLDEKSYFRVKTAPARPLTEIEEFRKSKTSLLMERAVVSSTHLIQSYHNRYDIESFEGQMACKTFLNLLEKLHECFKTKTASRDYRNNFSKAYRILYIDDSLCYLTEILDSAQEAVPCLYVNGTKYEFSPLVLEAGHKLFQSFIDIQHLTRKNFLRASYENSNNCVATIKHEMTKALEVFDSNWACYEEHYVKELMGIEAEARKYITDAINTEKLIQILENKEKAKGRILLESEDYDNLRKRLAHQIAEINAVANEEGKGRDDLTIKILIAAEGILRRISPSQSMSVRKLAENIRTSFMNIRILLKKFDMNVEIVDPQLKNNQELVNELMLYEKYWERGKHYFLNGNRCAQLIHFSNTLEGLCEKYEKFQTLIEYRDADIFMMIPMIMILKSIEMNDKGICCYFLPELKQKDTSMGEMYKFIYQTLHGTNSKVKKQKEQRRDRSLGRSIRFKRKVPGRSVERKWSPSGDMSRSLHINKSPAKHGGSHRYKTLLRNKKQYTMKKERQMKQQVKKQKPVATKFNYQLYNVIEKTILSIELIPKEKELYEENKKLLNAAIHKIKILSVSLERKDPMEWNTFLDVALES